eukprot:TRINITY_DN29338_c0_g3_i1.p1 TRINITY_DN29338_c0_g3~~TRINITY_DN29338_c0_g3_i1.p1  ORF type:complete len:870 (+),score=266.91 TRINITY_DN29338_c0_g3_i1:89-2611(+)
MIYFSQMLQPTPPHWPPPGGPPAPDAGCGGQCGAPPPLGQQHGGPHHGGPQYAGPQQCGAQYGGPQQCGAQYGGPQQCGWDEGRVSPPPAAHHPCGSAGSAPPPHAPPQQQQPSGWVDWVSAAPAAAGGQQGGVTYRVPAAAAQGRQEQRPPQPRQRDVAGPRAADTRSDRLSFDAARPGMTVRMTPYGFMPGRDSYGATVLHCLGDRIRVRWEAAAGLEDAEQWIYRAWWDGEGSTRLDRAASPPPAAPDAAQDDDFDPDDIPEHFLCPITLELMTDPVTAWRGVSYQRDAIAEWLQRQAVCPCTRRPLDAAELFPNVELRREIERFEQRRRGAELRRQVDKWRQGPVGAWRRVDPGDPSGTAYTRAEFLDFYGAIEGEQRWREAGRKHSAESREARAAAIARAHRRWADAAGRGPREGGGGGPEGIVHQLHQMLMQQQGLDGAGDSPQRSPSSSPHRSPPRRGTPPRSPPTFAAVAAGANAGRGAGGGAPRGRRRPWLYTQILWDACSSGGGLGHVQFLERELHALLRQDPDPSGAPASRMLPPMVAQKRRVVHELCIQWQVVCRSLDKEPKRSCMLIRTGGSRPPPVPLSEAAPTSRRPEDVAAEILDRDPDCGVIFPDVPATAQPLGGPPPKAGTRGQNELEYGHEHAVAQLLQRWAGRFACLRLERRRSDHGPLAPIVAVFHTAALAGEAERYAAGLPRRARVPGLSQCLRYSAWAAEPRPAPVVGAEERAGAGAAGAQRQGGAQRRAEEEDLELARRLQAEEDGQQGAPRDPSGAWQEAKAGRKGAADGAQGRKSKRSAPPRQPQAAAPAPALAAANTYAALDDDGDDGGSGSE